MYSFRNQVKFTAAVQQIPKNAVILEIGPHAILRSALRQNRPELAYIALMRKNECSQTSVASAVSELWRKGVPMQWLAPDVPSGGKRDESKIPKLCLHTHLSLLLSKEPSQQCSYHGELNCPTLHCNIQHHSRFVVLQMMQEVVREKA